MTARHSLLRITANAALGLTICALMLGAIEGIVRLIPHSLISTELRQVPDLAPPDRGSILLRRNGYRGRRPCSECPADTLRIAAMGGSSVFGVPMAYSAKTWPAQLKRLFDAGMPERHVEVLNGGIAGFGIWQILESLEAVVLHDRPDMLIISSWFNDSSWGPGWYGYHGLSDEEAYHRVRRLRTIESHPLYQLLRRSHAYGLLRSSVEQLVSPATPTGRRERPPRRRRSTPEEFARGLERVIELATGHGIRPVLIFEPLNRTEARSAEVTRNRYYQAIEDAANRHGLLLIDTLSPLAARSEEWLFYDFIHPNERGHRVVAGKIFTALTSERRVD